ncbi:MAG: hypothetical protein Fur0018_17600 [Anaerolineales bacterium]
MQTRRITLRFSNRSWWASFTAIFLALWSVLWVLSAYLPLSLAFPVWWPHGGVRFTLTPLSWPYAQALTTLALAVMLTAAVRTAAHWRTWGGNLLLLLTGLAAITAANPLTLALAWLSLDVLELITLTLQLQSAEARERLMAAFSARLAGILLLVWVSARSPLGFSALPGRWNVLLLLAVAMRLGVLPLHVPFLQDATARRRGLGTMFRLTAPVASLGLLQEIGLNGFPRPWILPLNLAVLFAGLFAAWLWLTAADELSGRPFWVLGLAALSINAALQANAAASTAWGVLMLLAGGVIFLASLRDAAGMWAPLLAAMHLLGLPYTLTGGIVHTATVPFLTAAWLIVHLLLAAGYVRHLWLAHPHQAVTAGEYTAYLLGMVALLIGAWGIPARAGWIQTEIDFLHPAAFALAGLLWVILRRRVAWNPERLHTLAGRWLSLDWFYRLIWRGYRLLSQGAGLMAQALEGEGGLLWMLIILLVLLSILQVGSQVLRP